MGEINILSQYTARYNVDSVEFCPLAERNNVCACGMYELCTDGQKRGGVVFLHVHLPSNELRLKRTDEDDCGVYQLKWLSGVDAVATAESDGCVNLLKPQMDTMRVASLNCSDAMLLSLAVSPTNRLVSSDASGAIHYAKIDQEALCAISSWAAHRGAFSTAGCEVWTCTFDQENENVVYSGAEDSLLKRWDVRTVRGPTHVAMGHAAGVISILSLPNSHLILTSSYDDTIKAWDKRHLLEPVSKTEGVAAWRMVSISELSEAALLCACMYSGLCLYNMSPSGALKLHSSQPQLGENLLYGCDWNSNSHLAVCCSFYDRKVSLLSLPVNCSTSECSSGC